MVCLCPWRVVTWAGSADWPRLAKASHPHIASPTATWLFMENALQVTGLGLGNGVGSRFRDGERVPLRSLRLSPFVTKLTPDPFAWRSLRRGAFGGRWPGRIATKTILQNVSGWRTAIVRSVG